SPPITFTPSARAVRSSSVSRRVFPTPDSPATNASAGLPATASLSAARSSSSSVARPTKGVLLTRGATPPGSRAPPPERGDWLRAAVTMEEGTLPMVAPARRARIGRMERTCAMQLLTHGREAPYGAVRHVALADRQ